MATFAKTSGKTIDEAFHAFDAANPHVYKRFRELALHLISKGRKRYSSKTILCAIRFEHDLETRSGDAFRINDIVTSRYARKFADEFPQYGDFFETRRLRSRETLF